MMEPLKNILQIYSDADKEKVLLHYLPDETTKKLDNHDYIIDLETLFLNDRIILVKRHTGKIHKGGTIIKITEDQITIKDRNSNMSFYKKDHYLFRYRKKNKSLKDNRIFYEELLNSLA